MRWPSGYCRERELPLAGRLELLLQAAGAVAHAHSRLVVHRDLKPSNILVTADGQVRLLDFGIAKLLQSERTADTALTQLSGRAMTLDYASPEQIRGEPLGTASDVYSPGGCCFSIARPRQAVSPQVRQSPNSKEVSRRPTTRVPALLPARLIG